MDTGLGKGLSVEKRCEMVQSRLEWYLENGQSLLLIKYTFIVFVPSIDSNVLFFKVNVISE